MKILFCTLVAFVTLVGINASAQTGSELSGEWIVSWPNRTQNAMTLNYGPSGFSGTYVNDAKEQCPLKGGFRVKDRSVNFDIQCSQWTIRMQGTAAADLQTISGSYLAYGNAEGNFLMSRHSTRH